MANYYLSGYTPPAGVNSASKVKEYQRRLGVKADGIWGPDTDAAYRASQQSAANGGNFYWGEDSGGYSGDGSASSSGYYLSGYTPPSGVSSASDVKQYQRKLGVKVDGIWGPDTDAAYRASLAQPQQQSQQAFYWGEGSGNAADSNSGYTPSAPGFTSYYNAILNSLTIPAVTVEKPSEQEVAELWSGILRPSVDTAVKRREEAARAGMAELDADAVSRGMGGSTYVTSMKERELDEAEEDIGEMEARYGAALAERIYETLYQYDQLSLTAQQYNSEARAAAESLAANLASDWYGQYMQAQSAERAAAINAAAKLSQSSSGYSSGSSGSGGSSSKGASASKGSSAKSSSLSTSDYMEYVGNLTPAQRGLLFNSQGEYWSSRRDEIYSALGSTLYASLKKKYGQGG